MGVLGGDLLSGCPKSVDADDNGVLEITDGVYLLGFLYLGGPAIPEPFGACGADPVADDLPCPA